MESIYIYYCTLHLNIIKKINYRNKSYISAKVLQ